MPGSVLDSREQSLALRQNLLMGILLGCTALVLFHALNEQLAFTEYMTAKECVTAASRNGLNCGEGKLYAPQAYRVLMPFIFAAVKHLFPTGENSRIVAGVDTSFFLAAFVLLWRVTTRQIRRPEAAWPVLAFQLAAMAYSVFWVFPLYRSETSITTMLVAFCLWCVTALRSQGLATALLLLAAVLQSTARTDATAALGAGLLVCGLLPFGQTLAGGRRLALLRGAATIAIAVAVQAYLQFVRFPGLHYEPGVPTIMVRMNLQPHYFGMAVMSTGPFALLFLMAWRSGFRFRGTDAWIAAAAAVELVLWLVKGSGAEPRILMPFLFACGPMLGRMALAVAGGTATRVEV